MDRAALQLTALADELIENVAIYCDGDAILALSRCSHQLRRICYVARVFEASFRIQVVPFQIMDLRDCTG